MTKSGNLLTASVVAVVVGILALSFALDEPAVLILLAILFALTAS